MIDIEDLKPDISIKFNIREGDTHTFWHFSPDSEYKIFTLQSAYPNAELENPNELIIWCDEIDIHRVKHLNPHEWDIVK